MHKKLQKYIESYDLIQDTNSYELIPNGGMIVLINQDKSCEVIIHEEVYILACFQSMIINAYEESITIKSNEYINLTATRFKSAGASFFYEEFMDEMMHHEKELDTYLQNRFKPSKSQFNVMKIIEHVENNHGVYDIDEVLRIANVPRKVFDKVFRWHAGMSLKSFSSIKKL